MILLLNRTLGDLNGSLILAEKKTISVMLNERVVVVVVERRTLILDLATEAGVGKA